LVQYVLFSCQLELFFVCLMCNLVSDRVSVLSPFLFALYLDDICNNGKLISISYVDFIVCLWIATYFRCVWAWTCMAGYGHWYRYKKSSCVRIGPRNDYVCANITTSQGYRLPWTNEIRYLGTCIVKSQQFRCFIPHRSRKNVFLSCCQCNIW